MPKTDPRLKQNVYILNFFQPEQNHNINYFRHYRNLLYIVKYVFVQEEVTGL